MLAGEGKVSSIGIVPGKLPENKEETIQQISDILGISVETINKALSASWVKDDTFVPIKKVEQSETEIKEKVLQISGIKITSETSRVYPLGEASAQLVGYVQTITAEELEKNKGKGYTSTSLIGKAGLEKQYEEQLKGNNGLEIYIEDENGKTNCSLKDVDGELLLVSQFTLYASCRKGNRPSFTQAGDPKKAEELYEYIIKECNKEIDVVQTGIFGAHMEVALINDGPFTVVLEDL